MKLTNAMRSEFVESVMSAVPRTDYTSLYSDTAVKFGVEMLPSDVQALYMRKPEYIVTSQIWVYSQGYVYVPGVDVKFTEAQKAQLEEIQSKREAQQKSINELHAKLTGAVAGVTTVKALRELLPEFESHMPAAPDKTQNLPALANIVADFVKAGWPDKAVAA